LPHPWLSALACLVARAWLSAALGCPFQRLDGRSASFRTAFRKLRQRSPVVIANLTDGWPARRWSLSGFLRAHGGLSAEVRMADVGVEDAPIHQKQIRDFLNDPELRGLILFSFGDWKIHQALISDAPTPAELQGMSRQPSFSLGQQGSGSGFHAHGEAWLAQVRGRKAWMVIDPNADPPFPASPSPSTAGAWLCSHLSDNLDSFQHASNSSAWCEVQPGQVFYVPGGWRHATCNLDSFTLAIGGRDDSSSWPPLFHTVAECRHQSIELTLRASSPTLLMAKDARGATVLHQAAAVGCLRAAQLIVAASSKLAVHFQDNDGAEPLHYAAINGHVSLARLLLAANADIRARDDAGNAPLHWAALGDHQAVAEFLLPRGAAVGLEGV